MPQDQVYYDNNEAALETCREEARRTATAAHFNRLLHVGQGPGTRGKRACRTCRRKRRTLIRRRLRRAQPCRHAASA
jgi:hypothetical protein